MHAADITENPKMCIIPIFNNICPSLETTYCKDIFGFEFEAVKCIVSIKCTYSINSSLLNCDDVTL